MKKHILTIVAMLTLALGANAIGYDMARQEALFLTDKMAYELNLSVEQMEAVYEINLDYLLSVNRSQDLYGIYWDRRNSDLRYVLSRTQYGLFINTNYFYRPLNWVRGAWSLALYGRYVDRHHFYFATPSAWGVFKGGRNRGATSYYSSRNFFAPTGNGRPVAGHTPTPSGQRPTHRPNQGHGGYQPGGNHPQNGGYQNGGNRPQNGGYQNGGNRPQNGGYQNGGNRPQDGGNRPNGNSSGNRPSRTR